MLQCLSQTEVVIVSRIGCLQSDMSTVRFLSYFLKKPWKNSSQRRERGHLNTSLRTYRPNRCRPTSGYL